MSVSLNRPQAAFLQLTHKFRAFVAGYGSGKTWVGCASLGKHFCDHPRVPAGYFAPSYPQIRDIFFPTIEEALDPWGFRVKTNEGNKEVHLYRGRAYYGTIICRSMERPESIVGFKVGRALVDEIDVLPATKAATAWRKIIARLRHKADGLQNGIDLTTTPEGYRFAYSQFVKALREDPSKGTMYGLIQASTYDNALNLPEDYIPSLLASYPPQLIDAYLNGQFCNLTSGNVYPAYDRHACASSETVQPGEVIHVGMDFNVGKMAAVTHVLRMGLPHAVDELVNIYDTPNMVRSLKERYWLYDTKSGKYLNTRQIRIYPDASGDSRRSVNASSSDLALLKEAGFIVCAPRANPPVKDRVNAMNGMFLNAEGARRYKVNADLCPTYAAALEQQPYAKNGEPDKEGGHDHPVDAAGYYIVQAFPIKRKSGTTTNI